MRERIRLWPLAPILLYGVIREVWILRAPRGELNHQWIIQTPFEHAAQVIALVLFWWVLLSRTRWRVRLLALLAPGIAVALFATTFRFAGVSGDLMPRFAPRWKWMTATARGSPVALDRETGTGSSADAWPRPPVPTHGDFPQFLGPSRDGWITGARLETDWTKSPPRELWRTKVGLGWSGFAIAGDAAVTQEQRGALECVVCRNLATGAILWIHEDVAAYRSPLAGDGPRATPTIDDGVVYAVGATGRLNALRLADGELKWFHDAVVDNGCDIPEWGLSASPLVVGELVVMCAGGPTASLVAYDRQSGVRRWAAGNDGLGYSSPALFEIGGVPQIVTFNHASAAGHDVSDGHLLWSIPWSSRQPNVAQPLRVGGRALVFSSGYGVGARCFDLLQDAQGNWQAAERWSSLRLKAKMSNMVFAGDSIFGFDDGVLVCIDAATGERRWKAERTGHGQMLAVADTLLVQTEEGDVVWVAADKSQYRELARLHVLDGKVWNPPALAAPILIVRNDQEAAAFQLPLAAPSPEGR